MVLRFTRAGGNSSTVPLTYCPGSGSTMLVATKQAYYQAVSADWDELAVSSISSHVRFPLKIVKYAERICFVNELQFNHGSHSFSVSK